jgi:PAS domain S-box-containing protein
VSDVQKLRPPVHLLVVDDNDASRYATSRVLRAVGFVVEEAPTGTEALRKAAIGIDLIVLDINLPDIDGFEVCRRLRTTPETADVPVCYLSASFTEGEDIVRGMRTGADSYLTHPIEPAVLIATVRTLLFVRDAHTERRASDARFRALYALAANGIAMLDEALTFSDVNPAFCDLFETAREALIGAPVERVLAPEQGAQINALRAAVQANQAWSGVLSGRDRGKGSAETRWQVTPDAGAGVRIAIITDVTAARRLEQAREHALRAERAARAEAERSNQQKEEFLATLSHELRNPLNAILGWADVLKRSADLPPQIAKGIDAIERNSKIQAHLIADLLDFAGIRFGKMRLETGRLNPCAAVRAAVEVVSGQAESKGVHLEVNLPDQELTVIADVARLQQIYWNLINNAIKFTPTSGDVRLDARAVDGQFEVIITDTGRGISTEFLPRLFDRFSQQDSGTAKNYSGLGIGLSIVHHLVTMHAGTISVSSEGIGRGARFVVRLPLADNGAAPTGAAAPDALMGARLLVVEDMDDTRALIARILREAGATVREAASAAEALEMVDAEPPDVLISDLGMPTTDGYQLIRALRTREDNGRLIPAIALTAFVRTEDRSDALEAGYQLHLSKPVNREVLIAGVSNLWSRAGAR